MDFEKLESITMHLTGSKFKTCLIQHGLLAILVYKGILRLDEARDILAYVKRK